MSLSPVVDDVNPSVTHQRLQLAWSALQQEHKQQQRKNSDQLHKNETTEDIAQDLSIKGTAIHPMASLLNDYREALRHKVNFSLLSDSLLPKLTRGEHAVATHD